jgi:hypothetical protein
LAKGVPRSLIEEALELAQLLRETHHWAGGGYIVRALLALVMRGRATVDPSAGTFSFGHHGVHVIHDPRMNEAAPNGSMNV